jgi:hypothetical protein
MANDLASTEDLGSTERAIVSDLCALLAYRGFAVFRGFQALDAALEQERWRLAQVRWEFTETAQTPGLINLALALPSGVLSDAKWRFSR